MSLVKVLFQADGTRTRQKHLPPEGFEPTLLNKTPWHLQGVCSLVVYFLTR